MLMAELRAGTMQAICFPGAVPLVHKLTGLNVCSWSRLVWILVRDAMTKVTLTDCSARVIFLNERGPSLALTSFAILSSEPVWKQSPTFYMSTTTHPETKVSTIQLARAVHVPFRAESPVRVVSTRADVWEIGKPGNQEDRNLL